MIAIARLARVENGNLGDHKTVDGALQELRMTFAGGLRIYFVIRGSRIVLLLHGGDKASDFIHAVGIAARAKGMTAVAEQAGVGRASLYKALSEDGKPAFETIFNVVQSFGLRLALH